VVEARVRELAIELGGSEVQQQQLLEAETRADQLRERLLGREKELAAVGERIQALTDAIRRGRRCAPSSNSGGRLTRSTAHCHSISAMTASAFLLQETFGQLVAGASLRL
jgi:hypothetical protein